MLKLDRLADICCCSNSVKNELQLIEEANENRAAATAALAPTLACKFYFRYSNTVQLD